MSKQKIKNKKMQKDNSPNGINTQNFHLLQSNKKLKKLVTKYIKQAVDLLQLELHAGVVGGA